jgi:ABC-type amino acid transport substrate-binding protein
MNYYITYKNGRIDAKFAYRSSLNYYLLENRDAVYREFSA